MSVEIQTQRLKQTEKDADDKAYYKQMLDYLDSTGSSELYQDSNISERIKMKVNYDLFNNKLDPEELKHVCKPFGDEEGVGDMPADMVNRDIISGKIKAIAGMEFKRPFSWKVVAVNQEATTRKEKEEYNRYKQFVMAEIMKPIQEEIEIKYQEQIKSGKLTQEQIDQIKQQVAEETQAMTPPEVKKYMSREHQDPSEVLSTQLMNYLLQKEQIKEKFNKNLFHAAIAGKEIYMIGEKNGEPVLKVLNPLYFNCSRSEDCDYIEDEEWGSYEFALSPSTIVSQFRSELSDDDIDDIYENYTYNSTRVSEDRLFSFDLQGQTIDRNNIKVVYGAWKSERKVGFLEYTDKEGNPQMMLVSEKYIFNPDAGDTNIDWQWIPETHHGYKVCLPKPLYLSLGPVPGQHRDLDNLNEHKLPFYGTHYDNLNSETTSFVDRIKGYQYYYNVIMYRIDNLLASDKGKILLMNINAIPKSSGINLTRFQYFLEANKLAYFNPSEEANKRGTADVNTIAKVLDMSLASDINQYIQIAEYIETKAGVSIGVPKQVEAQISADESVRNVQQNISMSSNILEPFFQVRNNVKRNVLQGMIEKGKVCYGQSKPRKLNYVLDDLSQQMIIDLNQDSISMLDNSTLGLFVANSTNAAQAKAAVEALAHAAMQTQQMDILDIVKVIKAEGMQEAEESLEVGINKKAEQNSRDAEAQRKAEAEQNKASRDWEKEKMAMEHANKMEEINAKGKIDIKKQTILSLGFNEDKDLDDDGTPDVLEVAKFGVEADIKAKELALKEKKQEQDNQIATDKLKIESERNQILKEKSIAKA